MPSSKHEELAQQTELAGRAAGGTAVLDRELRFVAIDEALAALNGASVEAHLGLTVAEALPELAPVLVPLLEEVLTTQQPLLDVEIHCETAAAEGRRRWLTSYYPIESRRGTVLGIECIVLTQDNATDSLNPRLLPQHAPDATVDSAPSISRDIGDRSRADLALATSEERLRLALRAANMSTWEWDIVTGSAIRANQIEAQMGLAAVEFDGTYRGFQALIHPEDREMVDAAVRRAIATGEPFAAEFRTLRPDGSVRWSSAHASVVFDGGLPVRMVGVDLDITCRKRAEEQQHFLAEATSLLSASLDYEQTLARIGAVVVPRLADYYLLHSVEEDGNYRQIAAGHRDPEKNVLLEELRTVHRADPGNHTSPVRGVMQTRQSLLVASTTPLPGALLAREPELARIYRALGPISYMIVPLIARGEVRGAITLAFSDSGRHYTPDDLRLVEDLARRIGLSLDNARLYRETEQAVREREAFLSIASHELKNPLTALLGQAQLFQRRIAQDTDVDDRNRRSVRTILEQAERLSDLLGDLLSLGQLEEASLAREPLDLSGLVNRVADEIRPSLTRHAIVIHGADQPLAIEGDEVRLAQVLHNLLSNAIKYSPDGGEVAVTLAREAGQVTIAVRDRGVGIPSEARQRLFQRFFRAKTAATRGIAGLGVGLYVVREIVARHGGTVDVQSEEGQGSTFTVRLPLG